MTSHGPAGDHSKISPTAKITAYWRSLSDIPFSAEIAQAVNAEETARSLLGDRIVTMGTLSPSIFEVRYKSINRGLALAGITNVLELACGLSPRGLEVVLKGGIYVGTDLPEMHAESSPVLRGIASRDGIPQENLHYQPANVLDKDALDAAAGHFHGEKFAVCNEGLLMYLSKDEKALMAENIRDMLLKSGGCWITTDIVFRPIRESLQHLFGDEAKKVVRRAMKAISEQTGRDFQANDFADKGEAEAFFADLGFSIKEFPIYSNGDVLSTAYRIRESLKERFLGILSSASAWMLTPRP